MDGRASVTGILLLAGSGTRFNDGLPKQFHKLSGKRVYLHSLEKFCKSQLFEEIILVCHRDYIQEIQQDVADMVTPPIRVVAGGATRQASSKIGASAATGDYIVIHDAVRPFVSVDILKKNVAAVTQYKAVDTCIASSDTLVYAPQQTSISHIPNRAELLRGQTPQSFCKKLLLQAHNMAKNENCTDDCQLVVNLGFPVHIVKGDESNIKITTMLDLFLAEQIFRMQRSRITPSKKSLRHGVYAVIGGTSGMGKALVQELQKQGSIAVALSRRSKPYSLDLMDEKQIPTVFKAIYRKYGALDGLINSAGFLTIKNTCALSQEEIDALIKINFTSVVQCCRHAVLKPGAHIINISSSSFYRGRRGYTLYSSMKAALVNFTQGFSEEHPEYYVNVIVPQRTDTPLRAKNFPQEDPSTLIKPKEVAIAIIDLLRTNDTTGTIFEVRKKDETCWARTNDPLLKREMLYQLS